MKDLYYIDDYKVVSCKYCGNPVFQYKRKSDGKYSERQVCDSCNILIKPKTKEAVCKKCGNIFNQYLLENGRYTNKSYCEICGKLKESQELVCIFCGKIFTQYRDPITKKFPRTKRCENCQDNKKEKTQICKVCGKTFILERNHANGSFSQRQICDNCNKPKTKTQICKKCGTTFEVARSNTVREDFLYRNLCDKCANMGDYSNKQTKICEYCGKLFTIYRYSKCKKFPDYIYCEDCFGKPINKVCTKCGKEFKSTITCRYKYSYSKSLCLSCYKSVGEASEYELIFADLLDKANIKYSQEFALYYNQNQNFYLYDFYLPDKKTFIEINPTYTHTSESTYYGQGKDRDYHKNKTKIADDNGYRCINVWQWDSFDSILNLIKPKSKLFARKLNICVIDKHKADYFIDLHHLQGSCYGNIVNLGLYDNDNKLVQVMTFGKPRYNKNYQWELLRLCTHSDYYVVGGAERLFKYFISNYNPESILSYCDVSKFTGNVYLRLGFKLLRINTPQKTWVRRSDSFGSTEYITDSLLRQQGFDRLVGAKLDPPEIYGKGTDNEELMLKHGWLPIYDCGQKIFIWQKV